MKIRTKIVIIASVPIFFLGALTFNSIHETNNHILRLQTQKETLSKLKRKTIEKELQDILNNYDLEIKIESSKLKVKSFLFLLFLITSILISLLLITQIIKTLDDLIKTTKNLAEGDINSELVILKNDSGIGLLQKKMREVVHYLQNVSEIAIKISKGDLKNLHIEIKSSKDVLNNSMNQMILYLKDIASISEKIAEKDLTVNIASESENDILKKSLKNMLINLKDSIKYFSDLSNLINQISDKLITFSNDIAFNAEQESAISEETLAASEEILASMNSIKNNTTILFDNIERTSEAIKRMLDSNKKISDNTEDLSNFSEKVYNSISNISESNSKISNNVSEFLYYSNNMLEKAEEEGNTIKETIFKLNETLNIVNHIKDSIDKSNKKSKEISLILDLIQEISKQTNLLSLNASIEAARAGENGRGFSIVAQEIRILAEKSDNSTKQIYDLIKTTQDYSNEASIVSERGKESIEDTFKVINETSNRLDFIFNQMKYSSDKVREINSFIETQNSHSQDLVSNAKKMINMITNLEKESKNQLEYSSTIITASEKMTTMTKHIEHSINEQLIANEQISDSMRVISDSSAKNLNMSLDLKNIIKELDEDSKNMKDFSSKFKLN
jgi:methyl-accepting chemotaxis protein